MNHGHGDHGNGGHGGHGGHGHGDQGHGHGLEGEGYGHRHHGGDDRRGRGPGGGETQFVDMEVSQMIYADAERMTRDCFRELLRDAIMERIYERFGDRIEAIGRLAADQLLDDLEANLAIESALETRRDKRAAVSDRLREIFSPDFKDEAVEAGEGGEGGEG